MLVVLSCPVCSSGISCSLARIISCHLFGLATGSVFLQLPVFFQSLGVRPVANHEVPPIFCALGWGAPRFFHYICTIHLYFISIGSVPVGSWSSERVLVVALSLVPVSVVQQVYLKGRFGHLGFPLFPPCDPVIEIRYLLLCFWIWVCILLRS